MSETGYEGIILIIVVFTLIAIPSTFISLLGSKMLNKLAYYPSKNPAIQMSIFFWLIVVEIVSFTLLLLFYNTFVDYNKGGAKNHERDVNSAIYYTFSDDHRCDNICSA